MSWNNCWQLHGNLKAGAGEVAVVLKVCPGELQMSADGMEKKQLAWRVNMKVELVLV